MSDVFDLEKVQENFTMTNSKTELSEEALRIDRSNGAHARVLVRTDDWGSKPIAIPD
jgi:hypothetical protein